MRAVPEVKMNASVGQSLDFVEIRSRVSHRDEPNATSEGRHVLRCQILHTASTREDREVGVEDQDVQAGLLRHA
jgi:hypothetical protein